MSNLGGNARHGKGDYLIAEADESDGSFLLLSPQLAVVTNIDNDHLDFHKTEENIRQAFIEFINRLPFFGRVALNAHDRGTQKILCEVKRPYVLFGIAEGEELTKLEYGVTNISYAPRNTEFDVYQKGSKLGRITTRISGEHNVLNAIAAIAICHEAGLAFAQIAKGIQQFIGVGRRLESLWKNNEFEVIDDYGHHPTEIRATLATIKQVFKKPVCVVFEPHRYSRTQQHWQDFVTCFDGADEVFIGPIYAASEAPIDGISGEKLASELNQPQAKYLPDLESIGDLINERKDRNMIFLTLGAGSISKKTKSIIQKL